MSMYTWIMAEFYRVIEARDPRSEQSLVLNEGGTFCYERQPSSGGRLKAGEDHERACSGRYSMRQDDGIQRDQR